jgi:hypothetical protein
VVVAAVSFAALIAVAPTTARADATPEAQAEARKEMRQAIEDRDAGKLEPALSGFRRAIELVPEANLPHRYAARTLEALGRFEEAIEEYEAYLRIKVDVSDAAAIRATVEGLRAKHVLGTLAIHCSPADAAVAIDGQAWGPGADREIPLAKGPHRVRVRAPGHVEKEIDVEIVAGTMTSPPCILEQQPTPLLRPVGGSGLLRTEQGETPAPGPGKPFYTRWWFWTGAGAVVAGTIVTVLVLSSTSTSPPSTEGGNHSFP